MPLPQRFLSLSNFELAWSRVLRGSNSQYKKLFSHLFPSFDIASTVNLKMLASQIRSGHYSPTTPTIVYYPKVSKILRPITLLTLNDQIVYQAIANYVAERFYNSFSRNYGATTFGAQLASPQNLFFYRSWKGAYRAFNNAIRRAYFQGQTVVGDFDLVSFFDLIDHKILKTVLQTKVHNGEILELLIQCLEKWTSANPSAYTKGHGIPQGPEPSAFLAETILQDFDRAGYKQVTYLRYIDDIKLLGPDFPPVRRAMLRLDLQAKRLGLVPQAQKIDVRRVTDIASQIKSVPSSIAGSANGHWPSTLSKTASIRLTRMLRNSIRKRKGDVVVSNETHFKFALNRLAPSRQLLRSLAPLLRSRPDLSGVLARFVGRFPDKRVQKGLLSEALRSDPVFDAAGADYLFGLDRCISTTTRPNRLKGLLVDVIRGSEEKSILLAVPCNLFRYKRASKNYVLASLKSEPSSLAASQIIDLLCINPAHASTPTAELLPVLRILARHPDDDLSRYATYLMLSELGLRPKKVSFAGGLLLKSLGWPTHLSKTSQLSNFFKDVFKLSTHIKWDRVIGSKSHSELQRRAILLRGCLTGSPSVLITLLDNFNDLLIQCLSVTNPGLTAAFKKAAGKHPIPEYGNWLYQAPLVTVIPKAVVALRDCHRLRVKADAHSTQKRSGQFTRPVSYRQKDRMLKQMILAYQELLTVFAAI